MNLDLTLGNWRNQRISLLGWASLANSQRAQSLGHQAVGGGWHLEQSNLLLMLNHPFNPRWSMDVGQVHAGWQINRPATARAGKRYSASTASCTEHAAQYGAGGYKRLPHTVLMREPLQRRSGSAKL
jgi:hypothetical protein